MSAPQGIERPSAREFSAPARITLFGHAPTTGRVRLVPRSRGWRTSRALRVLAVGLVAAPAVALVPPHAPWALGALAGGVILARRRWRERFTLVSMEAVCPRCGEPLSTGGVRLRVPHPLACENCNHEPALVVDDAVLAAHRMETD